MNKKHLIVLTLLVSAICAGIGIVQWLDSAAQAHPLQSATPTPSLTFLPIIHADQSGGKPTTLTPIYYSAESPFNQKIR